MRGQCECKGKYGCECKGRDKDLNYIQVGSAGATHVHNHRLYQRRSAPTDYSLAADRIHGTRLRARRPTGQMTLGADTSQIGEASSQKANTP